MHQNTSNQQASELKSLIQAATLGKRQQEEEIQQTGDKRRKSDFDDYYEGLQAQRTQNSLLNSLLSGNTQQQQNYYNNDFRRQPDRLLKKKKSVQWHQPDRLESVKYFKMNDEPNAPGLSIDEVMELQKHLVDVPAHMIPSELKKIEMRLDSKNREMLEERKGQESVLKSKIDAMKPMVRFARQLLGKCVSDLNLVVVKDQKVALGEKSSEVQNQKAREADKFQYYVRGDAAIPSNPLRELDELYSKDAKVPHIDLEVFAKEHKFNDSMQKLQQELDQLEPDQRSNIMTMLNENHNIDHDQLIQLANNAIAKFKEANQQKMMQQALNPPPNPNQLIKPGNYRTVPCKNYHGPTGCTRGDFCHFIHGQGFEFKELPREVFQNIRNQNIRLNFLSEIQKVLPKEAEELQKSNASCQQIQQFITNHNQKIMSDPAFAIAVQQQGGIPHNPMPVQTSLQQLTQFIPQQPMLNQVNQQTLAAIQLQLLQQQRAAVMQQQIAAMQMMNQGQAMNPALMQQLLASRQQPQLSLQQQILLQRVQQNNQLLGNIGNGQNGNNVCQIFL